MSTGARSAARRAGPPDAPAGLAGPRLGRALARTRKPTRRTVVIALSIAVAVGAAGFAGFGGAKIVSAAEGTMNTTVATMLVGDMTRSYTALTPARTPLPASAPIIIVLSGLNSTQSQEIGRDEFTSYVTAGEAELVYPLAYRESWNAIGCCSWAARANVNDVGFIEALVQKVDPGHERPIYLMGYSNGGRLAYRLACTDPLLLDGTAIVKADPMPGCVVKVPMNIIQVASTDDTRVPYKPGEKGDESPAATVQVADLRAAGQCSAKSATTSQGNMTYTLWPDCADGRDVGFAVYSVGVHSYPRPPVSYPAASQVIWAFFNKTATVEPQPKS